MPSPRDAMPSGRYVSHGRRCPMVMECVLMLVILIPLIDGGTGSPDAHGSSLYKVTDIDRKTWTSADCIELQCRKSIGLLIPGANFTDGDGAGVRFLQYFDVVKAEAKKIVSSVARKRAMIAVVDALGGYLHTKLLPHVREQYYAGRASYSTVKRLQDLDKNIKYILGTDGRGWARPIVRDQRSSEDVSLAMWQAAERKPRTAVRPGDGSLERCGGVAAGSYGLLGNDDPVPYFDNNTRPHSVVVPWRQGRTVLYGIRDAGCYRTLFDHLAAANMRGRSATLRQWLDEAVLPLVTARATDQWYPALWGVTLVARRLKDVDAVTHIGDLDGRGGGRGHRLQVDYDWTTADVPGHNFYAAIVLASAYVCWLVALIIALYPTEVQ
ncbi:unnamed protein product [Macrosiphum euphorbiae]|uniref:Uncharacterized protein n=1 Tax=Macrosiphum euphorbiae TaxID=13131 RepID=A0AAV0VWJ4_9HEMI|nr:unnamed protein product [Macrosiphum euphorbiae]